MTTNGRPLRIAFVSFNGPFFFRHFLPVIDAARTLGLEIFALIPPDSAASSNLIELPADVTRIQINGERTRHPIFTLPSRILSLRRALKLCKPDLVQAFALHPCTVLVLTSALIPVPKKVLTITGLGLIEIDRGFLTALMRSITHQLLRAAARRKSTSLVFENASDPARLGLCKRRQIRKMIVMGAGVNESEFAAAPLPTLPPLRIAAVSRMIWSKGIDLAVEAVSRLVQRGMPVELHIYGEPDVKNPRHFSLDLLKEWDGRPGITWHGYTNNVPSVWRENHVAIFPSRGGEGLPRAMLEAASCARTIIAANVPGCADFLRQGVEGILVEPDSVEALQDAVELLLKRPERLRAMGGAARERLLATATQKIITSCYQGFLAECMAQE